MSVVNRGQKASDIFDWAQRASVWEYHMSGGVDPTDVLEAALACRVCIDQHTPALSGRPYPIAPRIVRRFVREEVSEYTKGDDQADGGGKGTE